LRAYAASYNDMLEKNEAIIRTLIGEARRQPEYAKQVIQDAVRPVREGLIHYLEKAQQEGKVKPDLKLPAAVDLFTGMLLAGMLRRTAHGIADYAIPDYIDTCLEIFVSGIAKPKRKRK
jgi:hypothetical protein